MIVVIVRVKYLQLTSEGFRTSREYLGHGSVITPNSLLLGVITYACSLYLLLAPSSSFDVNSKFFVLWSKLLASKHNIYYEDLQIDLHCPSTPPFGAGRWQLRSIYVFVDSNLLLVTYPLSSTFQIANNMSQFKLKCNE